ncbi:MAG: L-aspartate oxidase [Bacteroidetes bacterium]|nr:L-aspartate oxidase [Bacteroidota bacterium]MCY4232722.1 L-aspartate oxidase [Bacteroidota bacterium]
MATRHEYDYLVLGSGIAGLWFALGVADQSTVAIITKKETAESNTNYAQGGIAGVWDENDSVDSHSHDTLTAGAGLCDIDIVRDVITEGPKEIQSLIEMGVTFTQSNGQLHLGREAGHARPRILHAKDATGREIDRVLLDKVMSHPNITVLDYHYTVDLITDHHLGQHVTKLRPDINCYGAYILDEKNEIIHTFLARVTVLATGGCCAVYQHTTNPPIATGDGVAMAYRAKARVANMEFIQFHPTALYQGSTHKGRAFLISEAVRGHGGILLNQSGDAFMKQYDSRAELAPRDIVARAIDDQLKHRGEDYVLLDVSHLEASRTEEAFPLIVNTCRNFGIDPVKDPIPVVPAAHYQCGGVQTDPMARTSIAGLLAIGEVAYTGLHGANRLASNSLLEALVFGQRAVQVAPQIAKDRIFQEATPDWDASGTELPREWVLISHNREELQRTMWNYVGIVRSDLRLARALRRTRLLYEEVEEFYNRTRISSPLCELRNLIAVSYLIIQSAQMRRESRGLHYTLDYPEAVDNERRPTLV